jgi:hypothetical protein
MLNFTSPHLTSPHLTSPHTQFSGLFSRQEQVQAAVERISAGEEVNGGGSFTTKQVKAEVKDATPAEVSRAAKNITDNKADARKITPESGRSDGRGGKGSRYRVDVDA